MTYRIEVSAPAAEEMVEAYHWLADRTSHAAKWFDGIQASIDGLAEFPRRCSLARENKIFGEEIRQLLYGTSPHIYRILFIVWDDVVHVLHVRHAAQRTMGRGEVNFPPETS